MAKKSRTFIWQFVIGLGFLSGLWTAVGIDPQAVILNLLGTIAGSVWPGPEVRYLFLVLPIMLLALSVIGAYRKGRVPGLVSVVIAYCAGVVILVSTAFALFLLIVAIAAGYLSTNRRLVRRWAGR